MRVQTKQGLLWDVPQSHFLGLCSKEQLFMTKSFIVIPPYPLISGCLLLKNKGKTSWDLKASLDVKKKLTNFDFKHLYWRFNITLAGYFFASKISYTSQLWAFRFAQSFCFLRREAGTAQTVFAYVWALNKTYLKLHHKETTVLSRVHWSLLPYCSLGKQKKPWIPNVTRLGWKKLRCYKFYVLIYYLHFKLIFLSI